MKLAFLLTNNCDHVWISILFRIFNNKVLGIERNYKVKTPAIQRNKVRFYSTLTVEKTPELILNPWFVTGFIDGEGSFILSIYKNKRCSTGWAVSLIFSIGLHENDRILLALFQKYFGVGKIYYETGRGVIRYRVSSQKDLLKIINHFDNYPLITNKLADYNLFKQAFELVQSEQHFCPPLTPQSKIGE